MRKLRIPNTYVIIGAIILLCAVATWFVPGGQYVKTEDGALTYERIDHAPQVLQVFSAIYHGFVKQAGIIVFILVVGGAFWLLNATGAVSAGISRFIARVGKRDKWVLVALTVLFSLAGAVFGMSEETIPFVGIVVPLAVSMGYDAFMGMLIVYVAANVGFSSAFLNPFTIGIAQGMADLPLFSGMGYRIFCWVLRLMIALPIAKVFYNVLSTKPADAKEFFAIFQKTTWYHYAIAAGFILFVAALILALIKPGEMIRDNNAATLSIMFFYLVLVYSSFLNKFAYPLMYYTRYLVPFISIAAIFTMSSLNLRKKIKAYITVPVFALCMCIFVPTNLSLMSGRDDTKLPWEVYNSIVELVDDNDAVIVAENTRLVMWMGIESRTNADVYPQCKDLLEQASEVWDGHDEIYIIKRYPLYERDTDFELVYMNTYDFQDECTWNPNVFTLYPTDFSSREETIYVYRMERGDHREYPVIDFYDSYTGLAGPEISFAWTGSEVVELNCDLKDRDYNMTVDLMPGIPFGAAEDGCINIDVYINDEFIETVTLAPGVNEDGFTVFIDDALFDEGDNVIRFESNLWSASVNNPADNRELGFAIENVIFEG